jgi:hypothetical protein
MELYERTTRTTADRLIAREVRPSSLGAPNSNTDDDIVWHARAITDLTGWAVVFTRMTDPRFLRGCGAAARGSHIA